MVVIRFLIAVATILSLAAPACAQDAAIAPGSNSAMVLFDAEPLFAVRGVSAIPASERAKRIQDRILALARDVSIDAASVQVYQDDGSFRIGTQDTPIVTIYEADAELEEVEAGVLASAIRDRIVAATVQYRADRTPAGIRSALQSAGWMTAAYLAGLVVLVALARLAVRRIERHVEARIEVWEQRSRNVLRLKAIWAFIRQGLRVAALLLIVLATYVWLNGVLLALPWTRDVGYTALTYVANPVRHIIARIAASIPDLIALVIIFVITHAVLQMSRRFFQLIAARGIRLSNFDPDWAQPTQRILRAVIILFAAIVAYPYIPGSSSEAFKAIGIFAGVMLSLGATSIVANLVAGHMLIYRRAFRVGDRISVGSVTGDVEDISAQATYVRTLKNERVTIPNALVMSSEVINYSHFARDRGLILHTTVGIGYEVPWKQVEGMLLEAARRTDGLVSTPAPFVLQTRLGDYSPVYELNAYTRNEKATAATYSALHAAIQDVFAEAGVQIMTPSYVADPPDPKVPPATDTSPARPPAAAE